MSAPFSRRSRAVLKLAAFLGRSPDAATIEELRRFQLHLVHAGTGLVTINANSTDQAQSRDL